MAGLRLIEGISMSMQILNNSAVLLNFTLKLFGRRPLLLNLHKHMEKPALFRLGDESLSPALEAELVGL